MTAQNVKVFDFEKIYARYLDKTFRATSNRSMLIDGENKSCKEYIPKGTVMISFFICIAGAFDKSSLRDGEGATETENL